MMKNLILLFFGLIFVSSCSGKNISGSPSSKYHDRLYELTRERRLFGLENVQYLTKATYLSRDLREKYVEEYAKIYHLPEAEKTKLLEDEIREASEYDVFFVSHFSGEKSADKLSGKSAIWRISLSTNADPAQGVEPISVIQKKRDPKMDYFYPMAEPFMRNYWIKFKKSENADALHLHMISVLASLDFAWDRNRDQLP